MSTKPPRTRQRKSLRQSLKELLNCTFHRSQNSPSLTVGSGILRKAEQSATFLPKLSSVSLLPDFAASQFNIDQYDIPLPAPPVTTQQQPSVTSSKHSLLPATSLSQYGLRNAYLQHAPMPQRIIYESIPEEYSSGISRQASMATLSDLGFRRSTSTLRLRRSDSSSNMNQRSTPLCKPSLRRQSRSILHRNNERPHVTFDTMSQSSTSSSTRSSLWSRRSSGEFQSYMLVEHFKCFCVLDTAVAGCPVTATSEELRYIFDVGEPFFLNNQEVEGTSMDIISGVDALGNPVTHLVLFSPLVSPSSGRSRFMLASLIDVTRFIHETASLPDLDTITEEAYTSTDELLLTPPPSVRDNMYWSGLKYELSSEDLLGGCFVQDEERLRTPTLVLQDDVWLNLATEERRKQPATPSPRRARYPTPPSLQSVSSTSSSTMSSVDDVLEDFMLSLQGLYSRFFLLAKSPLDDNYYEICNVSPTVYASKEYVNGHLSRTPRQDIEKLSMNLAQGSPFSITIRWGVSGEEKELYCSPLYGQRTVTWVCFLVDGRLPLLW